MAKRKFELSSSIISTEIEKNTTKTTEETESLGKSPIRYSLNFSTTKEFKGEYKAWCARKNLNMTEAFEKGFELLKNKHGD